MSAPSRRPRAGARRPEWNVYSTRQMIASCWRQPQERRGGTSAAENEIEGDAPRDFAALRALSGARADRLPRRLRQVASYALNHPDEIAFGTAASVAASAEVQPSTLVRFSQSLGYQGYSDFQDVFRARLRERVPSYDERLVQLRAHGLGASKTSLLLDGFAEAASRSVADMHARIDSQALERAVSVLANARTIYLLGLRRSFPI